ncbi:MAG TPA: diguanylate cyclase [Candidatus Acidoferrum sp.]|nr:diguanylate cyclase [Candidatus Acidoferrum sp.]
MGRNKKETPKTKILIADDSLLSRRILEAFLVKRDYEVVSANNGEEAFRLLSRDDAPRLAILDWMMPGMEGTQVCLKLREQSADRPYVYVLLLTARTEREDLLKGLEAGADDYVTKPFDPAELHARLRVGRRILDLQDKLIAAGDELRFRASHDALTGVANRAVILETLRREQSRQEREGGSFGVILLDIDHFKNVNDTYGHLCGDAVLKAVTRIMEGSLRPYDVVGRYGGEEFLLVVPRSDAQAALGVAERIRKAIDSKPIDTDAGKIRVTVSLGVAASTDASRFESQALLQLADDALYRAKQNGRDRSELAFATPSAEAAPLTPSPR